MAFTRFALGEIDTAQEAQTSLQFVALGCYAFACLALFCGLSKVGHGLPLATAIQLPLIFVLAGIFLPRSASRTLALVLAPLSLYFSVTSLAIVMGGRMSVYLVIDLVFSILLIWVTVRSIHATFRYHQIRKSEVSWGNVARVWVRAIVLFVAGVAILAALRASDVISLSLGESLFLGLFVLISIECFVMSTRRRPLVSYMEPAAVDQESEVSKLLRHHVVLAMLLPRMGQVRATAPVTRRNV